MEPPIQIVPDYQSRKLTVNDKLESKREKSGEYTY